ncbi:erythroblast NAD(P)(+)--arginine ADP-ribosyltransferase-like protein [Turdus rufiventris]|nr:erythroblast NAD(P)(+)--arginine ADP-ribosyltransferase-like protein [Turdus rufiventris]
MAYTMRDLYKEFNHKVGVAGRSPQEYRDNFHFKTLHFLLTVALATLRAAQEQQCRSVFRGVRTYKFKANVGDSVRFGQFASSTLCENVIKRFGSTTVFKVQTCHGAYIKAFSTHPDEEKVLIPPYEKFNVTKVIPKGEKVEIHLNSIGTYSKYNCEYRKGGDSQGPWGQTGTMGTCDGAQGMMTHWVGVFPGSLLPRMTHPGHHVPGSGHRDPLGHEATKVTEVSMVIVATMATVVS